MLVKAEFKADCIEDLETIEDDLITALSFYSKNTPGVSTSIEKYVHENKLIIKILKMDEQSN